MRTKPARLVAAFAGASVALGVSAPLSAAASTPPKPVGPRSSTVALSLAAPAVKPGTPAVIVATVSPAAAGRVVTLKKVVAGRYVGVAEALTDHAGQVRFTARFGTASSVALRAFVGASSAYRAAYSGRVVEDVAEVLPLDFPATLRLSLTNTGNDVLLLQQRLAALGYWLGTPDGVFGDSTQQAVYAVQKAAGITPSGIVGPETETAINNGVLPHPRTTSGTAIDVDLADDLVMFVHNGKLTDVLNTSTGGGYTYTQDGATDVATTPTGVFSTNRIVDGTVTDSLGSLWRPRFFYEGFALHGDSYVPSVPVSHGCVRVSDEAINWVWATNQDPVGTEVWVYG